MKKLNKIALKELVVESLKEIKNPRDEMTGTGYEDVRAGLESEPTPEELAPLDIGAYFKQVGEELKNRIEVFKSAPSIKTMPVMTPEQLKNAMEEMKRAKEEMDVLQKELEVLQSKLKTTTSKQ